MAVKRRRRFTWFNRAPLTIVELIIAISTMIGGLYVLSPLVHLSTIVHGATPIVAALSATPILYVVGVVYTLSGVGITYGIYKRKYPIRAWSLFANIMIRLYALVLTWLMQGLLPLTWLGPLTVLAITVVCYLIVRGMQARNINNDTAT